MDYKVKNNQKQTFMIGLAMEQVLTWTRIHFRFKPEGIINF